MALVRLMMRLLCAARRSLLAWLLVFGPPVAVASGQQPGAARRGCPARFGSGDRCGID
jgi:hypothetical protein